MISVIIPYYNESSGLKKTLDLILNQSISPAEVLLVNSSSTDSSYEIINNWIVENHNLLNEKRIKFKNLSEGTNNPASSKNLGIQKSTMPILAFMDCGLDFPLNWLEFQSRLLNEMNLEMVLGVCHYQGKGLWDTCAVALTSGLNRDVPATPSSLIKREVFNQVGLFENRRAGYDIDWRYKAFHLKVKYFINPSMRVYHRGYNFAKGPVAIFKKCFNYSVPSVGLKYYKVGKKYLILLICILVVLLYMPQYFFHVFGAYLCFRAYLWPTLKAGNIKMFLDSPLIIFLLPFCALLVDTGRSIGLAWGWILKVQKS